MYSIKPRPGSPQGILYITICGKRISLKTTNKTIAEERAKHIEKNFLLKDLQYLKRARLYSIIIDVKKEIDKDYNKSIADQYKKYIDRFAQHIGLNKYLDEIKPVDIIEYLRILGREYTRSTLRKVKTNINKLFYYALLNNMIKENPMLYLSVYTHKAKVKTKPSKQNKPIPWKYVLKVLELAPERYKTWWTIMAYTGLDAKDAATIEEWQIDKDKGLLQGKNRFKTGEPVLIPLHKKLLELNIVNAFNYTQRNSAQSSREHLKRLSKKVGYKENVNFKCLRHSFNTELNYQGISQVERSKILGQSSTATNEVYTHGTLERLQNAINKID